MLDQLYSEFLVSQLSKMPGGGTVCVLTRTTVTIFGDVYPFKPFDVLANKFYLDISNVDSDADTNLMLYQLFVPGASRCTTRYAMQIW